MNYRYTELRLDAMIGYLNDDKINLSPVFQRGHVWKLKTRTKLIRNIVLGRPIPAIFIYKEPSGSQYAYNMVDGKQRVESLILFFGNEKAGKMSIPGWAKYFSDPKDRKDVNFAVDLPEGKLTCGQLGDAVVAELGEYSFPTIEILLNDQTTVDEIIDLFVDINQEGEPVKRFDVVKAIGRENPLLQSVFGLVAREEKRGRDVRYKSVSNNFTRVLKQLSLIANVPDGNAKVDRIWERLLEIVFFLRTSKHRQPAEILKSFMRTREKQGAELEPRLSRKERRRLSALFDFLAKAYHAGLKDTPLATDQPHFYTMFTSILSADLLAQYKSKDLQNRLLKMAHLIASPPTRGPFQDQIKKYMELSQKQTTHPGRRAERQNLFVEVLSHLEPA